MILKSRPVTADDIKTICSFALDAQELFYMFPKAQYPLTEAQLSGAIVQRFDSTVVEAGNRVVGFANFYRAETGGVCYPKLGFLPFAVEERVSPDHRRTALIHMRRSKTGRA